MLVLSLPCAVTDMSLFPDDIGPCNYYQVILISPFLTTGASVFGVIFISIATVALCFRSFCSTQLNLGVRKYYRQALKGALPFLLLQICVLLYSMLTLVFICERALVPILLYPCSFVLLPTLLLCQPQVTHNLKCRRGRGRGRGGGGGGREDEDRLETAPTSYWSTAVSSRTQFIVPPESFFTEQDPWSSDKMQCK